jgi:hypothetical protein
MGVNEMGQHPLIATMRGITASDEAEKIRLMRVPLAHAVVSGRMGHFI